MGGVTYERELRGLLEEAGFLVVRAGGSLGVDLLAARGSTTLPIEVKSSHHYLWHSSNASGRGTEQMNRFFAKCKECALTPVVMFRLIGSGTSGWRVFMPDRIHRTPLGHYSINHMDGEPLGEFLPRIVEA